MAAMQGLRRYCPLSDGGLRLELTPNTPSGGGEPTAARIQRLISENSVIIFSRSCCCMSHVMKSLLAAVGVHPAVVELEEEEITALPHGGACESPALYLGGECVGGIERLMALHLSNDLVPKLVEVGALGNELLVN